MKLTDILKEHILTEGRVDDARNRYVGKVSNNGKRTLTDEFFTYLVDGDPSGNNKYLDWMSKRFLDLDTNIKERPFITAILDLVTDFEKYGKRLDKKDINQWKNPSDLLDAIKTIKQQDYEKKGAKEIDKVYEDDRFLVIIPKTHVVSCKYGAGTKWCTTKKDDDTYFKQYTTKDSNTHRNQELYYILDKTKNQSDTEYKVAFHVDEQRTGKRSGVNVGITAYNAPDREIEHKMYLADKPELWHIWNIDYTLSEKFRYGVPLTDEEEKELGVDGVLEGLPKFLNYVINNEDGTIREDSIPNEIKGDIGENEIYLGNTKTEFWFDEGSFETFIENHEDVNWEYERYFFHIADDPYYEDEHYDENELDYVYGYLNDDNVKEFNDLTIKLQENVIWDEEGQMNGFFDKHFKGIWNDNTSDLLYYLNQGVTRARQENLKDALKTPVFRYDTWGNGYRATIPTRLLLHLTMEHEVNTFEELFTESSIGDGMNLEDSYYYGGEVDDEGITDFNTEFSSILEKMNEEFDENNEKYQIIKSKLDRYGFSWDDTTREYVLANNGDIIITISSIDYEGLNVMYNLFKGSETLDRGRIHIDDIPNLYTQRIPFEK